MKEIELNNQETLERYEVIFNEEVLRFDEVESAKKFIRDFNKILSNQKLSKQISPGLLPRYEDLLAKYQFVSLSALPQETVLELLRTKLTIALDFGELFDLERKINGRMVSILVYEDRDVFKRQIRQAIQNNEELITIDLGPDGKQRINDWVNDYLNKVGADPVGNLRMNEYFSNDSDFQKLSADKKQKIRRLIGLFESMKLSSLTPEGLEHSIPIIMDSGEVKVYHKGVIEDIDKEILKKYGIKPTSEEKSQGSLDVNPDNETLVKEKIATKDPHANAKAAYTGDPARQQKVMAQAEKYAKKFDGNLEGLRREFYKAVQDQNEIKTIAAFRVLADLNDLGNFLAEDEQLHKFLASVWQKKYGDDLVAEFHNNANQPKFVKLFLRYILMERLNMSEHDAARVGINISNIYKKNEVSGFERIAYFNAAESEFKFFND
ncbi:MAG: hypothetical protein COT81_03650 [Candidatus Buchananbacteria bacterium CG10_big_fil_rev_8_21_14_0_10_42_9]|uniref:Uncharacterized protein n=1 Tax=Candidatus Buchananbacteria bacterium CG10_big_fil_rev_8_21_14_0_10_42_9 TaxID=1974526 RepID=A0A2H0W0Q4_9BACT|nr:MAG: hypothetical protein COT81_03650 [Candidatus Buchananbacteria bacterium CG10_big_fil_rev_8_21_14_0_10_42_9]